MRNIMFEPNWKRILAATDFSAYASQAVDYAHALAEKFGAELHVLNVTADVSDAVAKHGTCGTFALGETSDERTEWLKRLMGESGTVRRVEAVVVGPDVAEGILAYAQKHAIDMIVVATHGRTGWAHFWSGSIDEKVVRCAPCPVLAIRPSTADSRDSGEIAPPGEMALHGP
jgi:nucleotide-binding universal stress UspA family protein